MVMSEMISVREKGQNPVEFQGKVARGIHCQVPKVKYPHDCCADGPTKDSLNNIDTTDTDD